MWCGGLVLCILLYCRLHHFSIGQACRFLRQNLDCQSSVKVEFVSRKGRICLEYFVKESWLDRREFRVDLADLGGISPSFSSSSALGAVAVDVFVVEARWIILTRHSGPFRWLALVRGSEFQ
jgi:hypothetical protein